MFEFRVRSARSWLDPVYGKRLAAEVGEKLVRRCSGRDVVKIELTYNREPYADPQDLYVRSKEERHVRAFIAKLARYLGETLRGRWLCKLEFQEGGWVHWHLVVVGVRWIHHGVLTRLWGHGHVWIVKPDAVGLRYVCKYVSKSGALPAFLYTERMRSVKVIRVSPGFWGDDPPPCCGADSQEPPVQRLPWFIPIGEMIERREERVVIRSDDGRYFDAKCDPWTLFEKLRSMGCVPIKGTAGWVGMRGLRWDAVTHVAAGLCRAGRDPSRGAGSPPGEAGLHLIKGGNPPIACRRKWMHAFFEWCAGWREEVSAVASVGASEISLDIPMS